MDHRITITLTQTDEEVALQLDADPHSAQSTLMGVATRVMSRLAAEITEHLNEGSPCH